MPDATNIRRFFFGVTPDMPDVPLLKSTFLQMTKFEFE